MKVDYLIVGSGLTGATIARHLADNNREVMVIDRRTHAGGNVHDQLHPSGIRMHTYGPHYFRTNSDELWAYVNRFGSFYTFEAQVKSWVDEAYEQWPVDESYIRKSIGVPWQPAHQGVARNFVEASLSMMPQLIYEKFVKGYTEKQWGVPASHLSADLAKRFDVRSDDDPRFSRHKYQGLPTEGYAAWMSGMLAGIPTTLNVDYLQNREAFQARRQLIFTGPIDEFFGFSLGKLKYRGQLRTHRYLPDVDYQHPCAQVNNPQMHHGLHIRTLEWKHMLPPHIQKQVKGTLLTTEETITPTSTDHYEYPFPDETNRSLLKRYLQLAKQETNTLICGRLGEYRYFDMDQAISRARMLASKILQS